MLKTIVLVCLLGTFAHADCINNIPKSEVANAMGNLPVDGTKKCWLTPVGDPCVCHDGIVWEAAVLNADGTLSNDPTKLAAIQSARAAAVAAKIQSNAAKQASRDLLKSLAQKAANGTLSAQDQQDAVKALISVQNVNN